MTERYPGTASQSEPGADLTDWIEANIHPRLGPDWYDKVVAAASGDVRLAQERIWNVLYAVAGEEAVPED